MTKVHNWDAEQDKVMDRLRNKGQSVPQVAAFYGVTKARVYQWLQSWDQRATPLKLPKKPFHLEDKSPGYRWANKLLYRRKLPKAARLELLGELEYPEVCPILGTPLNYTPLGKKGPQPDSPSLDQIKPEGGYILGNVAVISYVANRIKNSGTALEHRLIADWMDTYKTN
jgi:hypothetical protein